MSTWSEDNSITLTNFKTKRLENPPHIECHDLERRRTPGVLSDGRAQLIWMAYRLTGLKAKSVVTRRLINLIKTRSLKKYNFPKIEKIICISSAVKNAMIGSIADPDRLEVIHSGIDLDGTNLKIDVAKEKKEFVIGYVAAFTEEKDHRTFIAAAKHLIEKQSEYDFKFLLVGAGPRMETMKKKTENLKEHFTFTGFVTDMNSVYSQIDILLHTSKSEALGTSILEAMKHRIPIVATKIGGIPEIIDNGQNGFLCKVGDHQDMALKIEMLAKDVGLRQEFVQNAQQKLLLFDKSVMINKTIELYKQVLDH